MVCFLFLLALLMTSSSIAWGKQFTKNDHLLALSTGLARRVLMYDESEQDQYERMRYIARMKLLALQLIQIIDSGEDASENEVLPPRKEGGNQ